MSLTAWIPGSWKIGAWLAGSWPDDEEKEKKSAGGSIQPRRPLVFKPSVPFVFPPSVLDDEDAFMLAVLL